MQFLLIVFFVALRRLESICFSLAHSPPISGSKLPLLCQNSLLSWDSLIDWGSKLKRRSLKNTIYKIVWQSHVYNIWLERNSWIHSHTFKDPDSYKIDLAGPRVQAAGSFSFSYSVHRLQCIYYFGFKMILSPCACSIWAFRAMVPSCLDCDEICSLVFESLWSMQSIWNCPYEDVPLLHDCDEAWLQCLQVKNYWAFKIMANEISALSLSHFGPTKYKILPLWGCSFLLRLWWDCLQCLWVNNILLWLQICWIGYCCSFALAGIRFALSSQFFLEVVLEVFSDLFN